MTLLGLTTVPGFLGESDFEEEGTRDGSNLMAPLDAQNRRCRMGTTLLRSLTGCEQEFTRAFQI